MRPDKKGLTLMELLIVLVIISIIAAVAIRMTGGGMKKRAIAQEAIAGLNVIRVQMYDYYYSHNRTFPFIGSGIVRLTTKTPVDVEGVLNIKKGELTGKYFCDNCYTIEVQNNNVWSSRCHINEANNTQPDGTWPAVTAQNKKIAASLGDNPAADNNIAININGNIYQNGISQIGLPVEP